MEEKQMTVDAIRAALRAGKKKFTYEVHFGYQDRRAPLDVELHPDLLEIEDDNEFMDEVWRSMSEAFENVRSFKLTGVGPARSR